MNAFYARFCLGVWCARPLRCRVALDHFISDEGFLRQSKCHAARCRMEGSILIIWYGSGHPVFGMTLNGGYSWDDQALPIHFSLSAGEDRSAALSTKCQLGMPITDQDEAHLRPHSSAFGPQANSFHYRVFPFPLVICNFALCGKQQWCFEVSAEDCHHLLAVIGLRLPSLRASPKPGMLESSKVMTMDRTPMKVEKYRTFKQS